MQRVWKEILLKGGLQTIRNFKPKILVEFDGEPDKNEMKQMLPEYQMGRMS